MKISLINGSPKVKNSASELILMDLKNYLNNIKSIENLSISEYYFRNNKVDNYIIQEVLECDVLVFSFPLYVDGVPSHLLRHLVLLEDILKYKKEKDIKVYALVNCGFYEGKQNKLAIEIIENWCRKCGITRGQGIGIGAGPLLHSVKNVPAEHGPKRNFGKALAIMSNNILNKLSGSNIFINANFPRFLYKFAGKMGWKKAIKANRLRVKDLYIRK